MTSDEPQRSMFGGWVLIPKNCTATVTLSVSGLHANGHVTPNHADQRVLFKQRAASGWKG